MTALSIAWPLAAIDVEASSLDDGSYPVEVGVAIQREPGGPVRVWSALVRPTWEWSERGHWSPRAAQVHGRTRERLDAEGRPPAAIVAALDADLAGLAAFCDGLPYDAYWLDRLHAAVGAERRFALAAWPPADLSAEAQARARACLKSQAPAHRAGADAERLVRALILSVAADPKVK